MSTLPLPARLRPGGLFGLMEGVLAKGAEPPPHVHHREDESFFVLEGSVTVRVGDEIFSATPGSFVFCTLAGHYGAEVLTNWP